MPIVDDNFHQVHGTDFEPLIDQIRAKLRSMNDGDISISAYDTAWVALVPRLDGGEGPQFPTAVQWILNNQLPDGSWGDSDLFSAYDRLINTLACVVTLTKWSLEPETCKKGTVKLRVHNSEQNVVEVIFCLHYFTSLEYWIISHATQYGIEEWT